MMIRERRVGKVRRSDLYPDTLCHFNPNHDPETGRFTRKQAMSIVRIAKKAQKNGKVWSNDNLKYVDELRSKITDEELANLTAKADKAYKKYNQISTRLWDEYDRRAASVDREDLFNPESDFWKIAMKDQKQISELYDQYDKADRARQRRARKIAEDVLDKAGITDDRLRLDLKKMLMVSHY